MKIFFEAPQVNICGISPVFRHSCYSGDFRNEGLKRKGGGGGVLIERFGYV